MELDKSWERKMNITDGTIALHEYVSEYKW